MNPATRRLIAETVQKTYALARLFEELKVAAPYVGQQRFTNIGIGFATLIRESLKMELAALDFESLDDGAIIDICSRRQSLLELGHSLIAEVVRPTTWSMVPTEIIALMESEIAEFGVDYALVLNPWPKDSYRTDAYPNLGNTLTELLKPHVPGGYEIRDAPEWCVILNYPLLEGRNFLLHTLMASHELMHFRDFVKNLSVTFYAKSGGPWFRPASPDEMRADGTIRNWLAELLADLLAVRRFGIAYFLAFAGWSVTHKLLDQYSESHPSSRYRLQFMLEELSDLGYDTGLTDSALKNEFDIWRSELATTVSPGDPIQLIASRALLRAKRRLQRFARKEMRGKEYPASKFQDIVEPLVEGVINGIPPAQLVDRGGGDKMLTADFPSILNAGWVTYVARMSDFSELTKRVDEAEGLESVLKLGGLIAKALELVEITGAWEVAASKL